MYSLVLDTGTHSVSQLKNNQRLTGTVWETKGAGAKAYGVKVTIHIRIEGDTRYIYANLQWIGERPSDCPETVRLSSQILPVKPEIQHT